MSSSIKLQFDRKNINIVNKFCVKQDCPGELFSFISCPGPGNRFSGMKMSGGGEGMILKTY